jgi:hypothetical protein
MRCSDIFAVESQMAYRMYVCGGSVCASARRRVYCNMTWGGEGGVVRCFEIWPTARQYSPTRKYMYTGNEIRWFMCIMLGS